MSDLPQEASSVNWEAIRIIRCYLIISLLFGFLNFLTVGLVGAIAEEDSRLGYGLLRSYAWPSYMAALMTVPPLSWVILSEQVGLKRMWQHVVAGAVSSLLSIWIFGLRERLTGEFLAWPSAFAPFMIYAVPLAIITGAIAGYLSWLSGGQRAGAWRTNNSAHNEVMVLTLFSVLIVTLLSVAVVFLLTGPLISEFKESRFLNWLLEPNQFSSYDLTKNFDSAWIGSLLGFAASTGALGGIIFSGIWQWTVGRLGPFVHGLLGGVTAAFIGLVTSSTRGGIDRWIPLEAWSAYQFVTVYAFVSAVTAILLGRVSMIVYSKSRGLS